MLLSLTPRLVYVYVCTYIQGGMQDSVRFQCILFRKSYVLRDFFRLMYFWYVFEHYDAYNSQSNDDNQLIDVICIGGTYAQMFN